MSNDLYRQLPSVDALQTRLGDVPTAVATAAARHVLQGLRDEIASGEVTVLPDVVARVQTRSRLLLRGRMCRVLNATGVVLHTNLGRARWSDPARTAALAAMGPCNLELDLEHNRRGGRLDGVRAQLNALVGCEDAVVVNNCAAAVLLALTAVAKDAEVVVSRGELVEIGGSFRVPEVVASGGARLVEVGTTNRTRAADFVAATGLETAAWLRVHPSNFRIEGFTECPDPAVLSAAAREAGVVLMEDLGSGNLGAVDDERTVQQALSDGADLVMFSGDKLLGGPQAGVIVGRREWVQQLRKHPLYRALRVGKVTLAALEGTLGAHLAGEVPALAQLHTDPAVLKQRAEALRARIGGEVVPMDGVAGGGTLPGVGWGGWGVCVADWADEQAAVLRKAAVPVLCRVTSRGLELDVRCLTESELEELALTVVETVGGR